MLAVLGSAAGCYPLKQYRKASEPHAGDCSDGTEPDRCSFILHETKGHPPYALGVVEFDDQGATYPVEQLDSFLKSLDRDGDAYAGRIVLVFAHGWFHDARPGDSNLNFFGEMLEQFSAAEANAVAAGAQAKPRRIIGLYLAWRGAAWRTPVLKYVTFWSRKDAAHRIGERQATEVLLKIRQAAYESAENEQAANRFVVMGHSFGAALVHSALSQLIANALLTQPSARSHTLPLADAVILFNAAFEAERVYHLFAQAASAPSTRPALTLLTAQNDRATGWAFPAARWLNNVFGSFRDVANPIRSGSVSERSSNARTVGHFDPLVTHEMVVLKEGEKADGAPDPDDVRLRSRNATPARRKQLHDDTTLAIRRAGEQFAREQSMTFGQTRLVPRADLRSKCLSVFNVVMPAEVWDGHTIEQKGERRTRIMSFLMTYVPFAARAPHPKPSVAPRTIELQPPAAAAPQPGQPPAEAAPASAMHAPSVERF